MTQEQAQLEDNRRIWYKFGIRAKQLLTDTAKVDADDFDVTDFQYLQNACDTALQTLQDDLAEHLRNYPD